LVLTKGYYASPKIIVKALEAMNTGTGNGALGGRLTRTVLYDFWVENPACRIPGATLTMD
jgi:hypothetical protein